MNKMDKHLEGDASARLFEGDKIFSADHQPQRKPFVEPLISVPKDVLEATTFFLQATPGTGAAAIDP